MSISCTPRLPLGFVSALLLGLTAGCLPLKGAGDVTGQYSVDYDSAWTIYEDGAVVARVEPGSAEAVELSEGVLVFDVLCEEADRLCPEEALWGAVEIEQPTAEVQAYIDIVNRDPEVGTEGERLPGYVQEDGAFEAFAGADTRCGEPPALGRVTGLFTEAGIEDGDVGWDYTEGCTVGGLQVDGPLRIEATFTATRVD